ncbi:MAG: formate dehydrogenase accessory sulfurtransferase FdhD [Desulfovibrio sp.]|jgi:FdhD protein|nr:formate dehydrogenase accessory sulfurtransferase FdhD [Desulfovibrio sp.]
MTAPSDSADRAIQTEHPITRIGPAGRVALNDVVLLEESYNLYCNGVLVTDLHCSPRHLRQLAIGHLFCRGLLRTAAEVVNLAIEHAPGKITVEVRPTQEAREAEAAIPDSDDVRLTADEVHQLQEDFDRRCDLYRATGAAHSSALADRSGIIIFLEDIARHNSLDKVIGEMLLQNISPVGKALILSGRMAYDMLGKAASCGVKLLIAPGAPSYTSIVMALERDITLLAFVRKDNINIYSHPQRIL